MDSHVDPAKLPLLLALSHLRDDHAHQKRRRPSCARSFASIALAFSLAFNLLFLHRFAWPRPPAGGAALEQGWSRAACTAAEEASLFDCSGRGNLYVDTLQPGAGTACECSDCFRGPTCSDAIPDCEANVDSGNPLLFEPFWRENAEASAVLIPGWYRIGYPFVEGNAIPVTPALEQEIRRLHKLVGNAVTEGRHIVIGTGSIQLINAAISSLAPQSGDAASVVTAYPFYDAYESQTELFQTSHYTWKGDVQLFAETEGHADEPSIELVDSPNNPDGTIRQSVLNRSNSFAVYDYAFYWPHFTPITKCADDDIMLFTLSKLTGHAGTRIGWAIIKDEDVYKRVLNYVYLNIISVSHESQLRATQILRSINNGYAKAALGAGGSLEIRALEPPAFYAANNMIFHYAYAKMRHRWEALKNASAAANRFRLRHHFEPQYCLFFKTFTLPYPAFAWIQCNQEDGSCSTFFQKFGIKGRGGNAFGESDSYIRISLVKGDSTFENFVKRLIMIKNT